MKMKNVLVVTLVVMLVCSVSFAEKTSSIGLKVEQLTSGEKHHFFGYIGQCRTIPWNAGGRYVLGLEIDRIDRLPAPQEFATVILVDTENGNKIIRLDKCRAWNPQQGTMFYWNPLKPETQFFFNDRDIKTGKVFTVLYDIEKKERVREYKFDDTPVGNGGVAADGSAFLAINYGRLARLRLVTGYPEALDWSRDEIAPASDGIFVVDIKTGKKRLLVSYRQLEEELKKRKPKLDHTGLFINHTLWNRDSDRVYFFVRGGWSKRMKNKGDRVNTPCSINADGTGLILHKQFIGGHPEWDEGNILIGREGNRQILYDPQKQTIVGQIGTPEMFPVPEGDISLSPDGNWFVNGYKLGRKSDKNYYAVYRRSDGAFVRSEGIDKGGYSGNIRIDGAPRWNRTNDAILIPGIAKNKTRQMFVIRVITQASNAGPGKIGSIADFPRVSEPIAITSGPREHLFASYYGINSWSRDHRYVTVLETPIKYCLPTENDPATLGLVDLETNEFIGLAETRAWNFQQGCMAHWLGTFPNSRIIYNDLLDGKYVSIIMDVRTRRKIKTIPYPVCAVSPNGKEAVSINFSRLRTTRKAYGYGGAGQDARLAVQFPRDDGLFLVDLETGEAKLLVSIHDVKEQVPEVPEGGIGYFNHVLFSREGGKIFWLSRAIPNRNTTAFTVNRDGTNRRRCFPDGWGGSHFDWLSEDELMVTAKYKAKDYAHVLFTVGRDNYKRLGNGLLDFDGHGTFSPDAKWMVTETYPSKGLYEQKLYLMNMKTETVLPLGRYVHPPAFRKNGKDAQCDLHPRWSPNSDMIGFNSVTTGKRQAYIIKLK